MPARHPLSQIGFVAHSFDVEQNTRAFVWQCSTLEPLSPYQSHHSHWYVVTFGPSRQNSREFSQLPEPSEALRQANLQAAHWMLEHPLPPATTIEHQLAAAEARRRTPTHLAPTHAQVHTGNTCRVFHCLKTDQQQLREGRAQFPEDYALVAEIDTKHRDEALKLTQGAPDSWAAAAIRAAAGRATSVGDVIVEPSGHAYQLSDDANLVWTSLGPQVEREQSAPQHEHQAPTIERDPDPELGR